MRRVFASAVLALIPCAAAAQAPTPVLTLEDALRLMRERNPDYRIVQNDLEVAESQTRQSWGAFLPTASASLGFNGSSSTTVTGDNDFGEPVRLPDPITFQRSSASQGIGASVTLFDGGRNIRNLNVARATEASTAAAIRATESNLTLVVTRQFFDAVKASRLVEVEERNLAAAQDRLARTQAQFRIAATNQVDVLQATRSVVTAERQLTTARANAEKSRLQLVATLGLENAGAFQLATELPPVFDPAAITAENLVARALAANPNVLQRDAAVVTARNRASAARGSRWPRISASFNYSRSMGQRGYGAFGEFNPLNHGYGFGVSASLPLFTGFQTSTQIAVADADVEDARQSLRKAMLDVERAVRAALVDLNAAHRSLQLAQENARISAEQVALAEELYRAGSDRYDFLQLQQLINDNQAAQRDAVDAQFNFIMMRAALEEILGGPLQP
jgi:outer membrane protein